MLLSFIKFSITVIDIRLEINFCTILFRGRVSFALHGSHVFVNRHKFKSSEIILPYTKTTFPYFSFVNKTRIITIGAELTQF